MFGRKQQAGQVGARSVTRKPLGCTSPCIASAASWQAGLQFEMPKISDAFSQLRAMPNISCHCTASLQHIPAPDMWLPGSSHH